LDSTVPTPDVDARQLVLFRLADGIHAIDLPDIREIIPLRRATRLPGAPSWVAGLVNVRGTVVTVLDLSQRLGGPPVGADASVVLVEHAGKLVGVAVDEVLEVWRADPAAIEPPGPEHAAGVVTGLGHSGGSIVIVLDIHAIIQHVLL
jgi:purine-binding chemotaxis protein CheW